jgi:hypothetical protein
MAVSSSDDQLERSLVVSENRITVVESSDRVRNDHNRIVSHTVASPGTVVEALDETLHLSAR